MPDGLLHAQMIEPIYVVGHVNPDTDAIAAAMGYAWLLRQRDGRNAIAARADLVIEMSDGRITGTG